MESYDLNGNPIAGASETETVGGHADTLLSISAPSAEITYFTVTTVADGQGNSGPLEIDDLSFDVPATPPAVEPDIRAHATEPGPRNVGFNPWVGVLSRFAGLVR